MKYLTIRYIDKKIELSNSNPLILCIENKEFLYHFLMYLYNDFSSKEDLISIYEDGEKKENEKTISFTPNLLNLDVNTKKNINALYKILKSSYSDYLKPKLKEINDKYKSIVDEIILDFELKLISNNEIKEDDIFKMLDLRFEDASFNLLEKFLNYVFVTSELQNIKVFFVLFGLKFFNEIQIKQIIKEASYKDISFVFIEDSIIDKNSDFNTIIIDDDLCNLA